ncbi:hypothetical protein ACF0H5_012099 [Mactra antiquata]
MVKATKLYKYVTIGLTGLSCIIGTALTVNGIHLRLTSGFFSDEVVTLLSKIEYSNIEYGRMLLILVYGMIGSGVMTIFTGVIGVYGAAKRSQRTQRGFIVLAVLLLIIQAVIAGFWVSARVKTDEWLKGEMLTLLGDYQGPEEMDEISDGWNELFMKAYCCGVHDQYSNGATTSDFEQQQSVWANTNGNSEKVPATCCQGVDKDEDITLFINTDCTTAPEDFYSKGCYEDLQDLVEFHSVFSFCAAGCLLIIKMFAIFTICYLQDDDNRIVPFFKSRS